jgi:hypothetical protein
MSDKASKGSRADACPGQRHVGRLVPWRNWAFWPWLRYTLTWHGWRAKMTCNQPYAPPEQGWKVHRCPDGQQCRARIGGGCASGWGAHYEVRPDETGTPRFPRGRLLPPKAKTNR